MHIIFHRISKNKRRWNNLQCKKEGIDAREKVERCKAGEDSDRNVRIERDNEYSYWVKEVSEIKAYGLTVRR